MSLGTVLKAARGRRSMRLVGEAAEISTAYVQKLERDQVETPSPNVLYRLAGVLDVPYSQLMQEAGFVVPRGQVPKGLPGAGPKAVVIDADVAAKIEAVSVGAVHAQLDRMTEARDLCKRQFASLERRHLNLLAWLRDEHPDVYANVCALGDQDSSGAGS
jgi:transcriptional regulator with XRE-family HTH domain